jgi:CBS domain-containing protein
MLVDEVMTPHLVAVRPDASVAEAARRMRDHGVGWLPVTDGQRVYGVVSDRDIVLRVLARDLDPEEIPVRGVATRAVVSCRLATTVDQAAALMRRKHVRRLLVADRELDRAGVLSLGDLAARLPRHRLAGETLAELHSEHATGRRQIGAENTSEDTGKEHA